MTEYYKFECSNWIEGQASTLPADEDPFFEDYLDRDFD
jgi:hypothetical protein